MISVMISLVVRLLGQGAQQFVPVQALIARWVV
jgi:hypothetical protein